MRTELKDRYLTTRKLAGRTAEEVGNGDQQTDEPPTPLDKALQEVTIFDLWQYFRLRGDPRQNPCCSPFRKDCRPSFSVKPDGKLFNDFGTGEGGNVIHFAMQCTRLDRSVACKWLIKFHRKKLAPRNVLQLSQRGEAPAQRSSTEPAPANKPLLRLDTLPELTPGSPEQHQALARLRRIRVEAVEAAVHRRLLWFCMSQGHPAWLVTDQKRVNAQARRLDGCLWHDSKVLGFRGNCAQWPVGILEAIRFPTILLVEGTPDLLAAFDFILRFGLLHSVAPVCITGAQMKIHPAALPLFQGKMVQILPHRDQSGAGEEGATKWAQQLTGQARETKITKFPDAFGRHGAPLKDLNDFVSANHAWLNDLAALLQPTQERK